MRVSGTVRVPGDKSITHRALMLGALAGGTSWIGGALTAFDARSTARVLRALGAEISPLMPDRVIRVRAGRRFHRPARRLDCGNSGTTTRLLLGLLAAHPFRAELTGDASLRRRPMRRVTEPLVRMGARIEELAGGDGLPLAIRGGHLHELRYELPVASAQVKSALLLAGMAGSVPVHLRESFGRTRDHTERLLRAFGFAVEETADGWLHSEPGARLTPFELQVPGDPSSAAFLVAAALLADAGELAVTGVGLNPTRTGLLPVLARRGASVRQEPEREELGEPVGTLVARSSSLVATEVTGREIPALIDEVPILAVLAARASGTTVFRDVGELRVKESDRLALLAEDLRQVGVVAEASGDALHVTGSDRPPRGRVRTHGDHRIAMAFAVLGTVAGAAVEIDDLACAGVSFPGFSATLRSMAARPARGRA
ncbi:MAG: 3-phosphoshikimate 1-carboxyvinyltransferase [Gemmatimonadales bacterium]